MSSKFVPGIYAIYRVGTDDCYVGQSVNMGNRWGTHRQDFRKNRHASKFMQRIFNKYGEAIFEFRVLEKCAVEDLVIREQFWMDELHPVYNACPASGSCLGYKHSEETREKHRVKMLGNKNAAGKKRPPEVVEAQSRMMMGNKFALGKSPSEEVRNVLSQKMLGNKHAAGHVRSKEVREAQSQRMLGNKFALGSPGANKGKHLSAETINRISATKRLQRQLLTGQQELAL
jgi:group I intron endonuclease